MNLGSILRKEATKERLELLHRVHVARYAVRLTRAQAGQEGYRRSELERLLGIWEEVRVRNFDWSLLSPRAREEVADALQDEFPHAFE